MGNGDVADFEDLDGLIKAVDEMMAEEPEHYEKLSKL
jgi:hypothetical protein